MVVDSMRLSQVCLLQEASGVQRNQAYDGWAQSSPGSPIDTVAISSDGSYDARGSFDVA